MKNPIKIYDRIKREAPKVPPYTCPIIDEGQAQLEELRQLNEALRDSAIYWKEAAQDLSVELGAAYRIIDDLESDE